MLPRLLGLACLVAVAAVAIAEPDNEMPDIEQLVVEVHGIQYYDTNPFDVGPWGAMRSKWVGKCRFNWCHDGRQVRTIAKFATPEFEYFPVSEVRQDLIQRCVDDWCLGRSCVLPKNAGPPLPEYVAFRVKDPPVAFQRYCATAATHLQTAKEREEWYDFVVKEYWDTYDYLWWASR